MAKKHYTRLTTDDDGELDKLVLGQWLHVERINEVDYFVCFYGPDPKRASFMVRLHRDGHVKQITPNDNDLDPARHAKGRNK